MFDTSEQSPVNLVYFKHNRNAVLIISLKWGRPNTTFNTYTKHTNIDVDQVQ